MTAGERDKPGDGDGEAGGFLSRWSRRKIEARRPDEPQAQTGPADAVQDAEAAIDPATLPPIESLTAESDFSIFLKKGVPPALRAAALRRLWLVEPSVVNYQPLVEYNWDFTAPGYGELLPTDDVARMAQRVFSGFSQQPKAEEPPGIEAGNETGPPALPPPDETAVADLQPSATAAEPEPDGEAEVAPPRRRHGGALPS
jgi:hypothetical protein